MRKLKLVNIVVPKIVAYISQGLELPKPEYICSCGMEVKDEYEYCPYCAAALVWDKVKRPSKRLKKLLKRL